MGLLLCQDLGTEKKIIKPDTISHNESSQHSELGSRSSEEKISKRRNDIIRFEDTRNNNQKIETGIVVNSSHVTRDSASTVAAIVYDDSILENLEKYPTADCNRCKRKFARLGDKVFKMCEHCRVLQRQRSKRWQRRTKQKDGVCTRCGTDLSEAASNYSLCQHCRDMLRSKKANRYLEGRCVHCSGANDEEGTFKVCKRCREKDKLRRLALEQEGLCNRCSYGLPKDEKGHKICQSCRLKKRKNISLLGSETSLDERSIVRNIEIEQLFTKTKHLPTSKSRISSKVVLEPNSNSVLKIKEKSRKMTPTEKSRSLSGKKIKVSLGNNRQSEKGTVTINSEIQIPDNFVETENNILRFFPESGKDRNVIVAKNSKESPEAPFADTNEMNTDKNDSDGIVAGNDQYGTQTTDVGGHGSKKRKVIKDKSSDIGSSRNVIDECDESESNDNEPMTILQGNLEGYHRHDMIIEKPPHENMILPQSFSIPHDHSQLNRQLKQLSQYTSHASTSGGDIEDEDDESVLVDLDDLESIGMGYDMEDVDAEASTVGEGNVEYEEEKETMLRHVRAVQAGLLSSTAEPSDAEMAAAVEAVAVAAAVARSREEEK